MVSVSKSKPELLAQALLEKVIEQNISPNSSLGTEAELLSTYNVARPTLRESLRILESQGVIEMRPGLGGGIIVRQPSIDVLAHGLSIFLRLHDVPFVSVIHARQAIEPALAREAAINGSEADFAEMAESIKRMRGMKDDQIAFIEENQVFHRIVARASGNKVLETFWSTLSLLANRGHNGMRYSFGNLKFVIEAHERILAACKNRDGNAAAAEMETHMTGLEHLVRSRYRHLLNKPTGVLAREGRSFS